MSNAANEEAFVDVLEIPVPPNLGDDLLQSPAVGNMPLLALTSGKTDAAVITVAAIAGLGVIHVNLDTHGDSVSQMEMPSLQEAVGTANGEGGAVACAVEVHIAFEAAPPPPRSIFLMRQKSN
jgi:hypothetical protein